MEIKIDLSGALLKTAALAKTPQAARKCLQRWGSETVLVLKRSAAGMKGSRGGRKSGQLARAVGMKMTGNVLTVGTNVQKQTDVKYAKIQDEGGWTHPRVTDKMRRWAWAMFYKDFKGDVKGLRLAGAARKGAFATFSGMGNMYKCIALTKQARLNVQIPASHWFSRPMFEQMPVLNQYMDPDFVYDVAANMAGVAGGGEA